ncbi:nucleoside deaminase [uncultured Salinisphaera sp.]|uniref:nucleoside deaminase n=1 Tax=uncultured Salinisphaera sp. TaxID=359372 RepID=UPI0032B1B2F9
MTITTDDREYLKRCVALAEAAVEAGDEPFGSILVDGNGHVLREERNLVGGGDATQHPEFALARWAAQNLTPEARRHATVYTSGEHCPMCAAAHAWVGLGRIVYASSMDQLVAWLGELGASAPPVAALSINAIAPDVPVDGPDAELAPAVRALHARAVRRV